MNPGNLGNHGTRGRRPDTDMIGLKRHTVQVVEHDPGWAALFARECIALKRTLGSLASDVQQVGSTAVPGLPAKPIIDIAVAVRALDVIPDIIRNLTAIGYRYRGDGGKDGGHLFVREPLPDIRTVHTHVVEKSDPQWTEYLLFRDILLKDPDLRKKYADLKTALAAQFPNDRKAYTDGKADFIQGVLKAGR